MLNKKNFAAIQVDVWSGESLQSRGSSPLKQTSGFLSESVGVTRVQRLVFWQFFRCTMQFYGHCHTVSWLYDIWSCLICAPKSPREWFSTPEDLLTMCIHSLRIKSNHFFFFYSLLKASVIWLLWKNFIRNQIQLWNTILSLITPYVWTSSRVFWVTSSGLLLSTLTGDGRCTPSPRGAALHAGSRCSDLKWQEPQPASQRGATVLPLCGLY